MEGITTVLIYSSRDKLAALAPAMKLSSRSLRSVENCVFLVSLGRSNSGTIVIASSARGGIAGPLASPVVASNNTRDCLSSAVVGAPKS